MAEQELSQKDLEAQLAASDVKVTGDKAKEMKENILKAGTGKQWLGVGVHEVFIMDVELTQAKTGTLGLKFKVENAEGQSEVTMWLSERALPYTIDNVSRLVVHNTGDDKKDAARTFMSNVASAKEVVAVAKEKLTDGVAFLSVKESKTNTYTNKNGEEKPSLERNLLAYAPKPTVEQTMGGGTEITKENIGNLPF